jgi:hypothetical protein
MIGISQPSTVVRKHVGYGFAGRPQEVSGSLVTPANINAGEKYKLPGAVVVSEFRMATL